MKKYIKPSFTIFQVNTESCIMQTSTISVTSTTVNSSNLAAGEYEELLDDEY